jgi:hypothetical protein
MIYILFFNEYIFVINTIFKSSSIIIYR